MFAVKVSILAALVSLSYCEPPATSYGVPINSFVNPSNPSSTFNHHDHHDGQDPDHLEPKSYEFGYAVKDDYTGNDYKRRETSDGNQVNGEYRVQLPDGRTQIVTYYADWQTGFHADVRYEGTASYPDQYANGNGNYNQGLNNQYGAPGFGGNFGGNQPSNQYGVPFNNNQGGYNNNQGGYNNNQGGYNSNKASSSVTIKDFSGPGTPYNTNGGYNNGYGNGNQFGNDYDSYASGNFGSRRPGAAYGAP